MNHLEDILRRNSRRARDFSPPPGQWQVIRKKLDQPMRDTPPPGRKRKLAGWIILGILGGILFAAGAVGYHRTSRPARPALSAFPLPLPLPSFRAEVSTEPVKIPSATAPGLSPAPVAATVAEQRSNARLPADATAATSTKRTDLSPLNVRNSADLTADLQIDRSNSTVAETQITVAAEDLPEPSQTPAAPAPVIIAPIPANSVIMALAIEFDHPPVPAAPHPVKRPAPSYWYVQAAAGATPRDIYSGYDRYQLQPNGRPAIPVPIQNTSEWLELYPVSGQHIVNKSKLDKVYSLLIGRQFSSGVDLSIGTVWYAESNQRDRLLRALPREPEIAYLLQHGYTREQHARLDLRYVFARRQRFQPYLGVAVIGYLSSRRVSEDWLYFPDRNISQMTSRGAVSGGGLVDGILPFPRAGFQYRLSPSWQVALDVLMVFPGVQIQYNIPKQ